MAIQGSYYEEPTDELKEDFLDLIAQGYTRPEAAKAKNLSARVMRALCNPQSHRYDENFARRYESLTEKNGEHHQAMVERLENAAIERAIRSSDRLLEKLLINKSPEWAIHRPQSMQINFRSDQMAVMLPELSTETLEQMRRELEEKKQAKQLGTGLPDIDVDPK